MTAFGEIVGRQLRTSAGKAKSRTDLIKAVHAAARAQRLGEEDRRAMQAEVTGKGSLTDMTLAEIGQVLDRLNRNRPAPTGQRAHVGKIRALWWTLYWLGEVDAPNDAALDAFVARQTGIASLRFVDHRAAPSVIEALKAMAARAGVRWPHVLTGREPAPVIAERLAVLDAIWERMRDAALVAETRWAGWAAAAIGRDAAHPSTWAARELDEAIKVLGKRWRRHLAKAAR